MNKETYITMHQAADRMALEAARTASDGDEGIGHMSEQTVWAKTSRTFNCKECKREWVVLDGDVIHPPEDCPFCKLAKIEKATEALMDLSIMRHIMILFPSVKRILEECND